ncbi:hypothetical protein [Hufsiella arboris]|nr:hypothetical protein [Hufsiella arboris]
MKALRILILLVGLTAFSQHRLQAQCAMCTLNADASVANGNTEGRGLNDGVLLLLAAPYIAVGVVGYLWYKKYRRKNVNIDIKPEKINLN